MVYNLVQPEKVSLKNHSDLNEQWLQNIIAKDPKIIGLGDLVLKDKERIQPRAGRLDLLLQEAEINKRYEVEIQLGKSDESHIIRTIEYWDIERKRYPQYEHCAVIIAEEITSRFLNVISLFNGHIPLIAIQLNAYKLNDDYFLTFTTVIDETNLGLVDEDEEIKEITNRNYWEQKGEKKIVKIADEVLNLINEIQPGYELNYNKFYIGLSMNGKSDNFILFRAKKSFLRIEIRLERSELLENEIEEKGLDLMDYDKRNNRYRIRLFQNDIKKHSEFIKELIRKAKGISGETDPE
jgi:hypothetical protein